MKKLMKNKRMISGLVATTLGVAILLMSLSLAWFTTSGGGKVNEIVLGKLDIEGELDFEPEEVYLYPGTPTYFNQVAYIQNTGTLNALCQLDIKTTIDKVGLPLTNPLIYTKIVEDATYDNYDPSIKKTHELGTWGMYDPDEGVFTSYNWLKGADGKYYIEMFGNDELHFAYDFILDKDLGNDYQAAPIKVQLTWEAIQADPVDAVPALIPGLEIKDLEPFPGAGYQVPTPVYELTPGNWQPFFTALPGFTFVTYDGTNLADPFGGDGVQPWYPDDDTLSAFGAYDAQKALAEAYLDSLPNNWLKVAIADANGIDLG